LANAHKTKPNPVTPPSVSIVVPLYNEEDNVHLLLNRMQEALVGFENPWELILVDDGSLDGTAAAANREIAVHGPHVHLVRMQRNFGQTAAMQAGIDHARGDLIVTLDGDLQNDPADIPRMVRHLLEKDLDLLQGWRKSRKDTLLLRKIPSRIANWLIGRVTGVRLHDYGCSLKVYRADLIRRVRLYGEMHRFIPTWMASATAPSRIGEIEVTHHPRRFGQSKYGLSRTFRVVVDLLSMFFFLRYNARPGHFFGSVGLGLGLLGTLVLGYLGIDKFVFGQDIGGRPLLLVGVLLVIASLQFLTTGVLAEILIRTYYESTGKPAYLLAADSADGEAQRTWKKADAR